jgi:hypothetical protein
MSLLNMLSGRAPGKRAPDRDEDIILSIWRKINEGACWGQFPDPTIVFTQLNAARAQIGYSCDGETGKLILKDGVTLRVSTSSMSDSIDDLFILIMHEIGHLLAPGAEHGPDFVDALFARGVTTKEVPGVGAVVTQQHAYFNGGTLRRLCDEWKAENRNGIAQRAATPAARQPAAAAVPTVSRAPVASPSRSETQAPGAACSGPSCSGARAYNGGPVGAPPAHAPSVTATTVPAHLGNVFIYADCSGSMAGVGEEVLRQALSSLWPIKGARVFTFTDESPVQEIGHPQEIDAQSTGTSFASPLKHAEANKPDWVLLFSDGAPSDEDDTWRVWERTTFPISTHFCMPAEFADHYAEEIKYMHALCRGGGACTIGITPDAAISGVKNAMSGGKSVVPVVHRMPDLSAQTTSVARQAAGAAIMAGRVVDIGNRVSQAEHDIHEVGQRLKIALAGNDVVSGIHEQAGEVFKAQDERDAQDAANRANASAQLDTGLQKFGAAVLGQTQAAFSGQIGADNSRIVDRGQLVTPTHIKSVPMGFGHPPLVNKAGAVLSGQPQSAGMLPPPAGVPAGSSQTGARNGGLLAPPMAAPRAPAMAALPAPSERPISAASAGETRTGRQLSPVRRNR